MSPRLLHIALLLLAFSLAAAPARAAQTCPAGLDLATPDADLIDNGDGTVTHTVTDLMWKKCSEGLSGASCATGTIIAGTWGQAFGAVAAANVDGYAGHRDWRLPNIRELNSIVETGCFNPAINLNRFPATANSNDYWSSTPYADDPGGQVWGQQSERGFSFPRSRTASNFNIRLVRGGQVANGFDLVANGCSLDVDGNGSKDALTDGLMILRAMFGLTGTAVTNGAIGGNALRSNWSQIRTYLNGVCGASFAQ